MSLTAHSLLLVIMYVWLYDFRLRSGLNQAYNCVYDDL